MKTADSRITITRSIQRIVETNVAPVDAAASARLRVLDAISIERREQWQRVIDNPLIEWGRDPGQLAEADITPPSASTIRKACELAALLGDAGEKPPVRVVPTVEGGVVFERQRGSTFEAIEVMPDGQIEYRRFVNSRLVTQEPWQIDSR